MQLTCFLSCFITFLSGCDRIPVRSSLGRKAVFGFTVSDVCSPIMAEEAQWWWQPCLEPSVWGCEVGISGGQVGEQQGRAVPLKALRSVAYVCSVVPRPKGFTAGVQVLRHVSLWGYFGPSHSKYKLFVEILPTFHFLSELVVLKPVCSNWGAPSQCPHISTSQYQVHGVHWHSKSIFIKYTFIFSGYKTCIYGVQSDILIHVYIV